MAGVEPALRESKSRVLPLHYIPVCPQPELHRGSGLRPPSSFYGAELII